MNDGLQNLIRREVLRVLGTRATTRSALVDSYDPANHAAKVRFQPEDSLSGWLPVATMRAGNGAGVHFAPNIGDQVLVHFLEGEHETGVVGMRLYSDADRPLNVPAGQMWMVDDAGAAVKLTNDGNVSVASAGSGSITVTANSGTVTVAAQKVVVNSSNIQLGGAGGKKVALDGDSVSGGVVHASSADVTAS